MTSDSSFFPTASASLPSPHLPLRKNSQNRRCLHLSPRQQDRSSPTAESSSTSTPTPSSPHTPRYPSSLSPRFQSSSYGTTPDGRPSTSGHQHPQSPLSASPLTLNPPTKYYTDGDFLHDAADPSTSYYYDDDDDDDDPAAYPYPYLPPSVMWKRSRGLTTSSQHDSSRKPASPPLKLSSSIPDLRRNPSSTYRPERAPNSREATIFSRREHPLPWQETDEVRASFRSALTNGSFMTNGETRSSFRSAFTQVSAVTYASSGYVDASGTERSSVVTQDSSISENYSKPKTYFEEDEGLTVEDAISMYAAGFEDDENENENDMESKSEENLRRADAKQDIAPANGTAQLSRSEPTSMYISDELTNGFPMVGQKLERGAPEPLPTPTTTPVPQTNGHLEPAPQSTSRLSHDEISEQLSSPITPRSNDDPDRDIDASFEIISKLPADAPKPASPLTSHPVHGSPPRVMLPKFVPEPRDRYGFKRASQYVSLEKYDAWNAEYTKYLERRRTKWNTLMKQYGLSTKNPTRFPPKSDKVKRYVRKGIPPEWRGAAWFWYAGGYDRLAAEPGLYQQLVTKSNQGFLSDSDKDIIERDLHRTFPDNIKFKPDPVPEVEGSLPGRAVRPHVAGDQPPEPRILGALRRVLQAFAIHNPGIGYCQSLNFLAGLLLLFLDEDEEKAFVMLNVLTNVHLPGTHAKVLEANVDVGVLMSCIRESMPAVWARIDDSDEVHAGAGSGSGSGSGGRSHMPRGRRAAAAISTSRLPTVSLATTSWFMTCFVGNLPIETVLRVWDSLFYEGSKTLFRIALAVFKAGEADITANRGAEHMEVFQIVQQFPRRLVDANALMECCFRRRNGFGHLSQDTVDARRRERREALRREREKAAAAAGNDAGTAGLLDPADGRLLGTGTGGALRRAASRARTGMKRAQSRRRDAR